MDYCTQREITSSSWTGLIFQLAKIIFHKNTSFVFFELIFLLRNVLIILSSAKNLVYDIQSL